MEGAFTGAMARWRLVALPRSLDNWTPNVAASPWMYRQPLRPRFKKASCSFSLAQWLEVAVQSGMMQRLGSVGGRKELLSRCIVGYQLDRSGIAEAQREDKRSGKENLPQ